MTRIEIIKQRYKNFRDSGQLHLLAKELGITRTYLVNLAGPLGLTGGVGRKNGWLRKSPDGWAYKKKFHQCVVCGNELKAGNKFCSKRCRDKSRCERISELRKKHGSCLVCGVEFVGHRRKEYCGKACYSKTEKFQATKERHWLKRRRKLKSGEDVNRLEVFRRDDWTCSYCFKRVRRYSAGGYLSGDEATLDHIIPISCGGSHSFDNVTTSCWECNCQIKRTSNLVYED